LETSVKITKDCERETGRNIGNVYKSHIYT